MHRARLATLNALSMALLAVSIVLAAQGTASAVTVAAGNVVGWPVASLLVSEVQTGGASASDEFVELTNAGPAAVDLLGLEIAYVTSTGGTVTRKASWTASLLLEPGRHLLVANSAGTYASIADATYSGGFAATGGAIVLRVAGGAPIDAIGWGDATNAFVEGLPAPAPAAGSSLERRPGGLAGNGSDTNDNVADWLVQSSPSPQNLAAPPVPAPGASPTPLIPPPPTPSPQPTAAPTASPTATPTPSASSAPSTSPSPQQTATAEPSPSASAAPSPTTSAAPTPEPSANPTATPEPTNTPTPTASPTPTAPAAPTPTASPAPTPSAAPTPTAGPISGPTATPTMLPTSEPTPAPTPSPPPGPTIVSIAAARDLPVDSEVTVDGTLTTALGRLESGRVGFVQDATAGIAVYLDAEVSWSWPAGTLVRISGRIDERYGARTLRAAESDVQAVGAGPLPEALDLATGSVGEAVEGRLVEVDGLTIGSPGALADGVGLLVDDGSGSLRVIVSPELLGGATIPSGTHVVAWGPVGQRDSGGSGTSGYRIHATEAGSIEVVPAPEPSPSPGPGGSPEPTSSPDPTATPSASATPSATPSAAPTAPLELDIASARSQPIGTRLRVTGVVIAEAGRLGLPPVFAIGDAVGGLAVRLADGMRVPRRGTTVSLDGTLAAPYGQLELRLVAGGLVVGGPGFLPAPAPVLAADLGEPTEGRLVTIGGTLAGRATKTTSGDISADFVDATGARFRVYADASSGLTSASFASGHAYELVGIVGQHASRKGALDGYRIWLRDASDVRRASVSGPAGPSVTSITIAEAIRRDGDTVTIEATVSAGPGLLDSTGRRVVVADPSGAVELVLPAGVTVRIGDRIRATGEVGRAWGAPRIAAASVDVLGPGAPPRPETLGTAPGPAHEWRLVRIAGQALDVRRLGTTWRAEVLVGRSRVIVVGLAGAGIASTAVVEGRPVTIVGIVRRPYPSATDRRYQVVPRGPADVALGPSRGDGATTRDGITRGPATGAGPDATAAPIDVDLATLADHVGELVRVGGLVVAPSVDGFTLDDATAVVAIILRGEAGTYRDLLEPGDALNAIGRVERRDGGLAVIVEAGAGLVRVGDLGETLPMGTRDGAAASRRAATDGLAGPALADAGGPFPGGLPIGLSGLAAISILSIAVTVLRRRTALARAMVAARARVAGLSRDDRSA